MKQLLNILFFILIISISTFGYSQPNTNIDLTKEKSEKNKERKLTAEKTGEKKFNAPKRFFSNLYTHYNYYFNANNRLNEVIEKAKRQQTDNYTQLLPFYNYSLNETSQNRSELDSVIYKATAGILLHDLRSDWVDDMYLILGKALMFRKDFDSAQQVFKYLNYIYAEKDDGYDIPIGSNASNNNGIFTVSTDEKKANFFKKLISKPIKRNDAFIWMARTYLEAGETGKATGLLSLLRSDQVFPKRLLTDLHELVALNFYQLKQYDSAAWHLNKSLSNAQDKKEKARWEFLAGQLYQAAGNTSEAFVMYQKAIKHAQDPLMEVYARLNMAGVSLKNEKQDFSKNNLDELYKLAKKERFETYRDVIYYTAGLINLREKNTTQAIADFLKSTQKSVDNPTQKNKSFFALAGAFYDDNQFLKADFYYDSVTASGLDSLSSDLLNFRKPILKSIVQNIKSIQIQDSLQAIAKLSPKEINALIKKIYKQYSKGKGDKDASTNFDFGNDNATSNNVAAAPLFPTNTGKVGEFYFLNTSAKTQGSKEFKSKWGNRPNVDNWNRSSSIANQLTNDKKGSAEKRSNQKEEAGLRSSGAPMAMGNPDEPQVTKEDKGNSRGVGGAKEEEELTPESMYLRIPLSIQQKKLSDSIIIECLNNNGFSFSNKLEAFQSAIDCYDTLLKKYPGNKYEENALFYLSYCYKKLNKIDKSAAYKKALVNNFGDSKFTDQINGKQVDSKEVSATNHYQSIYSKFLEGNFEEAKIAKKQADSLFGDKYWTPQLSFIEAVYYIKQKEDSIAINRLENIAATSADMMFKEKAKTMIDVLKRRKEIETYLSALEIEKKEDSILQRVDLTENEFSTRSKDTTRAQLSKTETKKEFKAIDKLLDKPLISLETKGFIFVPNDEHFVAVILNRVDDLFIGEAKNAFNKFNKQKHYNLQIGLSHFKLNDSISIILQGPFENAGAAMNYIDITKPQSSKVIPWISGDKYSYSLINNTNIELLKASKDIYKYKDFIKAIFPDKF